jgi:carbon monoxide dehydrogenase subunit G
VHTYTGDTALPVPQEDAYAYLSEVSNLPRYFPRITDVEERDGDEVETTAVIEPPGEERQEVHGTAWFHADPDAHLVTWGSEGDNRYHGELEVSADGDGRSSHLRIAIHTEADHPGIEGAIDETLRAIGRQLAADAGGG